MRAVAALKLHLGRVGWGERPLGGAQLLRHAIAVGTSSQLAAGKGEQACPASRGVGPRVSGPVCLGGSRSAGGLSLAADGCCQRSCVPPVSSSPTHARWNSQTGRQEVVLRVSSHQAATKAAIPLGSDGQLAINGGLRPGRHRDAVAAALGAGGLGGGSLSLDRMESCAVGFWFAITHGCRTTHSCLSVAVGSRARRLQVGLYRFKVGTSSAAGGKQQRPEQDGQLPGHGWEAVASATATKINWTTAGTAHGLIAAQAHVFSWPPRRAELAPLTPSTRAPARVLPGQPPSSLFRSH